jgi:hypothetical protein
MLSQAFHAVADLLRIYEMDKDSWHLAAILGHSKQSELFLITSPEATLLWDWNVLVVSQLLNRNLLTGMLDRLENNILSLGCIPTPCLNTNLNSEQFYSNQFLVPGHTDWEGGGRFSVWPALLLFLTGQLVPQRSGEIVKIAALYGTLLKYSGR